MHKGSRRLPMPGHFHVTHDGKRADNPDYNTGEKNHKAKYGSFDESTLMSLHRRYIHINPSVTSIRKSARGSRAALKSEPQVTATNKAAAAEMAAGQKSSTPAGTRSTLIRFMT
ncbi:MAG: hypothetical protein R6U98_28135 [Pirellulaceae bacterium]